MHVIAVHRAAALAQHIAVIILAGHGITIVKQQVLEPYTVAPGKGGNVITGQRVGVSLRLAAHGVLVALVGMYVKRVKHIARGYHHLVRRGDKLSRPNAETALHGR